MGAFLLIAIRFDFIFMVSHHLRWNLNSCSLKINTSLLRRKHMKSTNIFASLLLVGAVVASGSAAHAGAGAASGSIAVQLSGGTPTSVSSSIAVGKQNAASTARTATGVTFTSAFGSASTLTLNDAAKDTAAYVAGSESVPTLTLNQGNTFTGPSGYNLTTGVASIPY
jgi:hypothetical protein